MESDKPQTYEAVIIGGGVAGASVAYALSKRKIKTLLLEKKQNLSEGASGNPSGLIYPLLTKHKTSESIFSLSAFRFLNEEWEKIENIATSERSGFYKNGICFLTDSESDKDRYFHSLDSHGLGKEETFIKNDISFLPGKEALYFPKGKTISPPLYVSLLCKLSSPHLTIHTYENFLEWEDKSPLQVNTDKRAYQTDKLFLCLANEVLEMPKTKWLPIKKVRGQIVLLPKSELLSEITSSILFGHYLTEDIGFGSVLGASFDEFKYEETTRIYETIELLESAKRSLPVLKTYWEGLEKSPEVLRTRVSCRSQTQDRRPLLGRLPNSEQFKIDNPYKKGESHIRKPPVISYYKDVSILGGLGSRGLNHSLFGAEIVVRESLGEDLPIEQELFEDFKPERFLIRNWKRGTPIED
ncbi:FAD-dependent 5-carboxymethylaminomethyl-2-thiouridine(34) oxidoreductase MnmC [Leptospira ilyithenensis]|uniref:FAD-dependent 5-carboxymethylaminomethyl-2-thiouridine(34) oxidoreductase MnmC n=1 Tax=Leptospira ilyithenensis TaxID=2484901 RepID=UPI0014383EE8|nr:FAD-dependent 5-carboxymethylaminomethyl-2-thiouridine(34) oxidoreductase MnmC [Leptospira ilyithenensis]